MKIKSCDTGGETKSKNETTLPLFCGPNKDAVRKGKQSRFAKHLQRVTSSKVLAELIIFTGSVKIDFLLQTVCGGSHPAEKNGNEIQIKIQQLELNTKIIKTKLQYKEFQRVLSKLQT